MAMGKGLVISNVVIWHWFYVLKGSGGKLPYLFYFMIISLQLSCEWHGPIMVTVQCELMWPGRLYFMQYDYHGLFGTT